MTKFNALFNFVEYTYIRGQDGRWTVKGRIKHGRSMDGIDWEEDTIEAKYTSESSREAFMVVQDSIIRDLWNSPLSAEIVNDSRELVQ